MTEVSRQVSSRLARTRVFGSGSCDVGVVEHYYLVGQWEMGSTKRGEASENSVA